MSLLFNVVFHSVCRNTHHWLAVDALRHLRGADAERWTDLFIHHHAAYLTGSKAPDDTFKDFRNHVLHVAENYWGGAPGEARRWYGRTVDAFRRREWQEAVYSAGVLSHYFADPFMPLHTGQTEEETKVHRAIEWSIAKSYGVLQQIIEHDQGGYPALETPKTDDWLERMIRTGAELSHEHYHAVIDHYDLARGVREPPTGMDQECQNRIAVCLSHAVVGYSRVLERALAEAEIEPPVVETTLQGFLAALSVPIRTVLNHVQDLNDRMAIEAIYDEMQRTGKVVKNLPADDREIRQLHAEEILKVSLHQLDQQPAKATGSLYGSGAIAKYHRNQLVAAPVLFPREDHSIEWRSAQDRATERKAGRPQPVKPTPAFGTGRTTSAYDAPKSIPLPSSSQRSARFDIPRPTTVPSAPPRSSTPLHVAAPASEKLPTVPPAPPEAEEPKPRQAIAEPKPPASIVKAARFYLHRKSPVVDAPTIGPKTAAALEKANIITVSDLLDSDAEALAAKLKQKQVTADVVRSWQREATLVCCVPELRGHDAQLLVAAGITEPMQLATHAPEKLLELLGPIAESPAGKRILRHQEVPNLEEVADWIGHARSARPAQAA